MKVHKRTGLGITSLRKGFGDTITDPKNSNLFKNKVSKLGKLIGCRKKYQNQFCRMYISTNMYPFPSDLYDVLVKKRA